MIVDFHNHYYPEVYLKELERGVTRARLQRDDRGRLLLHYPGDYNVVVEGHRSIDERLRVMDEQGIDVQAFSLTTPGVHVEEPKLGIQLARMVNDAFAEAATKHAGRFAPLAALPLQDPDAAAEELDRAITRLGHKGALLFSNIDGRPLDDPAYLPMFARAAELDVPLFIHPTNPASIEAIEAYRLTAILGFLFDTTIAITRLVFAGVLEKYPNLKFVLGHLGGTMPYVAERADRGYEAYTECRDHITRPPTEYLKRTYLDTVNFQPRALRLALDLMGPEHIVFGSDYPHEVGNIRRALDTVCGLPIEAADRDRILGGNAVSLLRL
ncbi:MAG: amidohydrolase family protein [Gammaproteobacteria bacterium]